MVNQRNKFDHNHCVSARNDFADNSGTELRWITPCAPYARAAAVAPSSLHPPVPRAFCAGETEAGEYADFGLSSRAGREKCAAGAPGDYRPISSRPPLIAIRLSACSANLVSIGFTLAIPDFGEGRRNSTTPRRATSSQRDILVAMPVDTSKRRIRWPAPTHKAAQLPAFF
jgi:hypothetical protein